MKSDTPQQTDRAQDSWPVLKLDLNERCEGPPEWVAQARDAMPDDLFWRYTERTRLEEKLAHRYRLSPDQVLVTNGGDEAILTLISALEEGTPIFLPTPTFGVYLDQAEIWPVEPVLLQPHDGYRLDLEALIETIRNESPGLAIIGRPNNPTGEMIEREQMLQLFQIARERGTRVLVDEAYAAFASDNLLSELGHYDNLILLRTFSKAYGFAGLRVGYLLGSASVLGSLRSRMLPYNLSSISLYFAECALEERGQTEMHHYVNIIRDNRDHLVSRLNELSLESVRSEGNFVFLDLGQPRASFVASVLKANGILVRSFDQADLRGCLRITIPQDIKLLESVLLNALDPQLLCLDIDGCLIDVRESFDAVVSRIVERFTGALIERDEIMDLRAAGGFNDDNVLSQELIRRRGMEVPLEEILPVFRLYYIGAESAPGLYTREKPLISADLLEHLLNRYKVALITGRNREEAALAFPVLGLPQDTLCITVDDVAHGKPDPQGILYAMEQLDCRRAWMLGDNLDDILAARNAGVVPIGVSEENRSALLEGGAVTVLPQINRIEELL